MRIRVVDVGKRLMTSMWDALDATIVAQFQYPREPTPRDRAKYRAQIRREIMGCAACELHKDCSHRAFSSPSGPVRMTVVGTAPAAPETRVEPAFRLLRSMMHDAGINPVEDVLWANTVSCWPNTEGQYRDPTATETAACRRHLLDQIEASYSPFVLLVGAKALHEFRTDLSVTHQHGEVFVWNDIYVVMPITHPAAVTKGQSGLKHQINADLKRWHDIIYSLDNPLLHLGDTCAKCKTPTGATMWDRDGVPYCASHYEKWKNRWLKERERWLSDVNVQLELI